MELVTPKGPHTSKGPQGIKSFYNKELRNTVAYVRESPGRTLELPDTLGLPILILEPSLDVGPHIGTVV